MQRGTTRIFHATVTIFLICLSFLLLRNADIAANGIKKGVILCRDVLLPSLLPFLVISELFLSCGAGAALGNLTGNLTKRLFGISGIGGAALFGGIICGVPVGAACATSLYKKGEISGAELSRLLSLSSLPSIPFIITVVGCGILGNSRLGVWLYLSVLLATITVGIIEEKLFPIKNALSDTTTPHAIKSTSFDLVGAIRRGGYTFLQVSAFVLFFSFVAECMSVAATALSLPPLFSTMLCGMLEITTGMQGLTAVNFTLAPLLAAFFAGFSGLSIALQIFSISEGTGKHCCHYLISKLIIGVFAASILYLFMLMGVANGTSTPTAIPALLPLRQKGICFSLMLALFLLAAKRKTKK